MLQKLKVTIHLITASISYQYQLVAVPAQLAQVVRELVVARELMVALGVGNKLLHYY